MPGIVIAAAKTNEFAVADRLAEAGATNEWAARAYVPANDDEAKALEAALASKRVHRTGDGRYWADPERIERQHTVARWTITLAIAVLVILLAILYVTGEFGK